MPRHSSRAFHGTSAALSLSTLFLPPVFLRQREISTCNTSGRAFLRQPYNFVIFDFFSLLSHETLIPGALSGEACSAVVGSIKVIGRAGYTRFPIYTIVILVGSFCTFLILLDTIYSGGSAAKPRSGERRSGQH